MSIATQVKRLQNVRNQIRTKMVALGLSKSTDLLQDLADDLDGVDKISPTNNGTTDPGTGYTNVDTLSRSTSTRYIKVPKGYNDADRKFTVSGVANGAYSASVSSHTTSNAAASSSVTGSVTDITTTAKPSGTDGTDYYTITPKLSTTAGLSKATGKATIDAAGYLDAGNKSSSESSKTVEVTASQGDNYYLKAGSYSASVASHTTSNATASSNVSGSIVNITSATKPTTGYDGADYYTITPKLTTAAGSSKATGKATVGTAGYLSTGDTTSTESSKTVGVTASQGSSFYLKAGSYSASVSSHTTSNATAGSSVTGSVTSVATTTKPAGTDGTDYYTIIPKLTTGAGSSKATGKATIGTSGYLAVGNTTSEESSKSVGVTATQGDNYYLKAGSYSPSVASHDITNASASSSVAGSITNVTTTTKPSGTDGTDYYTITPELTTKAGSSKATGKATISTAGYLATGNTTSSESSVDVGVEASPGKSYYLKASSVTKEKPGADPGTSYTNKATVTPSTSTQYVKVTAGYLPNSKIKVEAIPSPYFNTSGVTATASTVLEGYKFVNSSGTTVTGTIATASSSNISGSVSGSNPEKITLTTEKTSGSSSTTATASATVTKGLYTGSSNIEKDLTSQDFTATAEAALAASVTGTDKIPNPLPPGTVEITPSTDNTKRIYSDTTTNRGFITNVVLKPMSTSSVTIPDPNKDPGTDYTNQVTVTPSGTSAKYVKITAGHLPNSKITVEKMAGGSVADATTTKPDTSSTSYPNQTTVTPTKTTQYVKITAGYLPNSKITVGAIPSTTLTVAENTWTKLTSATELGSYSQTVTGVTGVLTDNDVVVVPGDSSMVALYGVYASGQGASSITFKAFDKPTSDISYKVYILNK